MIIVKCQHCAIYAHVTVGERQRPNFAVNVHTTVMKPYTRSGLLESIIAYDQIDIECRLQVRELIDRSVLHDLVFNASVLAVMSGPG